VFCIRNPKEGMNIIQKQAEAFITRRLRRRGNKHQEFLSLVRTELHEYKKDVYKLEFLEHVQLLVKQRYEEHLPNCTKGDSCLINIFFENALFFLQEEVDEMESRISPTNFTRNEKSSLLVTMQKIIDDVNQLKLGQQLTYDDFSEEFTELKDLFFINKKNWQQLFLGKISSMVASGVVSQTVAKEIVGILQSNYSNLINT